MGAKIHTRFVWRVCNTGAGSGATNRLGAGLGPARGPPRGPHGERKGDPAWEGDLPPVNNNRLGGATSGTARRAQGGPGPGGRSSTSE